MLTIGRAINLTPTMKTITIAAITSLAAAVFLPSCTAYVDPTPPVTTQATTTTTTADPWVGSTTQKKTTTTTNY